MDWLNTVSLLYLQQYNAGSASAMCCFKPAQLVILLSSIMRTSFSVPHPKEI